MDFVHPDDLAAVQAAFGDLLTRPNQPVLVSYCYQHKAGGWTWMEATGRKLLDDPGVRGIIASSRDVTARRGEVEAPLRLPTGTYAPTRRVIVGEAGKVQLTPIEARMLDYFSVRPGEVIPPVQLLRDVWGYDARVKSRTAYVTVERLRRKIERTPDAPMSLVSRPGLGYVFAPQE